MKVNRLSTIIHTDKEVPEVMEINHTHQYETVDTPIEMNQNPVYSATTATNIEVDYNENECSSWCLLMPLGMFCFAQKHWSVV